MVLTNRRLALALALVGSLPATARAQTTGEEVQSAGPRRLLFGFALECVRCERMPGRAGLGRAGMAMWRYTEYPHIVDVAPLSAADRAGIRQGDVLLDIDGRSLLSEEGARAFSSVRAGDTVRLTLERESKAFDVTLTVGMGRGLGGRLGGRGFGRSGSVDQPPDVGMRAGRGMPGRNQTEPDRPDYIGHAGTTAVEVWSSAPVLVSTDSSGATVLRIGVTTIRLRPEPTGAKPRTGGKKP